MRKNDEGYFVGEYRLDPQYIKDQSETDFRRTVGYAFDMIEEALWDAYREIQKENANGQGCKSGFREEG